MEASARARSLRDRASPAANTSFIFGDSKGAGALGRSFSELKSTRLFVSGLEEGMAAVDADTIRRVYAAALDIAKTASLLSTRERASGLIQALSESVGNLRIAISNNRQPVPRREAGASPFAVRSHALAEPAHVAGAGQTIGAALKDSVQAALDDLTQFIGQTQRPDAEAARESVRGVSRRYDVLSGGADALAWYSLDLADFKGLVDAAGVDSAGLAAVPVPLGRDLADSAARARAAKDLLDAQARLVSGARDAALSSGLSAGELGEMAEAMVAPLEAELAQRTIDFESQLKGRAAALGLG